jgi:small subunit ribosomal protein S1
MPSIATPTSKKKEPSFADLYNASIRTIEEGNISPATIVEIRNKEVVVDVGYKSEAILGLDEFSDPQALKVGDSLSVYIESCEDRHGMVVVSKRKADRVLCWDNLVSTLQEGSVIEGKIFKKVRGGFMVDIGMEAFLPASLVALKQTKNLDQFLGQTTKFKVVKINQKRKNIVVSRKDYLEGEKTARRATILESIQEGQVLKGRVKNITDFGAFIDLGGLDGLLHITDMSWGRIAHPSEVVKVGDEMEVQVIGFDKTSERVSLGLKQLLPNPWDKIGDKYQVNDRVKGKVVNILPYGVFVELEKGIEGLVHISELSWTKRISHPSEVLTLGDLVEAVVLSVDTDAKKISLGIKQIEANPWLEMEKRYPAGNEVEGTVKGFADYGVFVELEEGIGGLIHVSDISWLKKAPQPSEFFKKGERIKARVLSIDIPNKKIALGIKQMSLDPWTDLVKDLLPGSTLRGTVSKVVGFGVFIELPSGLEGLLHISEIPEAKAQGLDNHFKIGESLEVMVLQVDAENRKISFSLKQHSPESEA